MVDATVGYIKKESIIVDNVLDEEIRAVYISYLEYLNYFYNGSKTINQNKINKIIDNIHDSGLNTIILHVSPFSDSIYESKIFPYSYTLTGIEGKNPGFDYLDYFIKTAHQKKIKIYAWINPYRISFEDNIQNISIHNPAYKLYNTSSIYIDHNGIYYNPASEMVKKLIISQVEEIINKYDVDGIHFDDYFYIQQNIDKLEYDDYIQNGGKVSYANFRLDNTNDLIKRVYSTIKKKNNKIVFSIAPDGIINNNYQYHYADVKTWLNSNDYIDMIMPQIYYGFDNEYAPFTDILEKWQKLVINKNIKIVPVLAFYKVGSIDDEAGKGRHEWMMKDDIISKQIEIIRLNNMKGYALFRYDYMYNKQVMNKKSVNEMVNLKKNNKFIVN